MKLGREWGGNRKELGKISKRTGEVTGKEWNGKEYLEIGSQETGNGLEKNKTETVTEVGTYGNGK